MEQLRKVGTHAGTGMWSLPGGLFMSLVDLRLDRYF